MAKRLEMLPFPQVSMSCTERTACCFYICPVLLLLPVLLTFLQVVMIHVGRADRCLGDPAAVLEATSRNMHAQLATLRKKPFRS